MPVVVVESPAKAKTINKYLGDDYRVLASYGHIRDLPPKDGSIDVDNDFSMKWQISTNGKKHVKAIADALLSDQVLILATDPDREGEAISWHLEQALRKRRAIKKQTIVNRIIFNAITQSAVRRALKNPRKIDMDLVQAYLARRALDYLVGFNLSPLLWRKLPGSRSAGRVQSVSLRLIVEREIEIEKFKPCEYWTIETTLKGDKNQKFKAILRYFKKQKLKKYDLAHNEAAQSAAKVVFSQSLSIKNITRRPSSRHPSAPFMTSTLQQEAARKLNFNTRHTMSLAQRLYESGHITYMRTDGIDMVTEAIADVRRTIELKYGQKFVPTKSRVYKNKVKNAQEAHECIRPTNMSCTIKDLSDLDIEQQWLYDLIWKRTIASQMASAKIERTRVDIGSDDGAIILRANGHVIIFDGFLRIYEEGRDDQNNAARNADRRLPPLSIDQKIKKITVKPVQHFTQPPSRYSEATLVKQMEELGIGRPSTYASIITTIQERDYVIKQKNRFIPKDKGCLVTAFLQNYFNRYVSYDFTARLEQDLDNIAAGDEAYQAVLSRFWCDFSAAVDTTLKLRITDVLETISQFLAPYLFPATDGELDPRLCKKCHIGRLFIRTTRSGEAFIGCSHYPKCHYTRSIYGAQSGSNVDDIADKILGVDENGIEIILRNGRFGAYVQRGEACKNIKKPPRASIPKGIDLSNFDLTQALKFLSLPRRIGEYHKGGVIKAAIGRYGPYVVWHKPAENNKKIGRKIYANIGNIEDVFTINIEDAVAAIKQKNTHKGQRRVLKNLGEHPTKGGVINLHNGKYGTYVKWGTINASLPKGSEPLEVTIEQAIDLIAQKLLKNKNKKPKSRTKKRQSKKKKNL